MEITKERREELLSGVRPSTSAEKGNWCPDVRSAPDWVKDRVVEIRAALADGRPIPPPTRSWIQGAEQRMLAQAQRALRVVKQTLSQPLRMTLAEVRQLSRQTGRSFEDILYGYSPKISEDRSMRMKLDAISDVIRRDKQTHVEDDLEDDDADWNERKHERAAVSHRAQAQRSSLEKGVLHYNAADAHDYAATHFNRYNSRAARRASKKAMPESMVS
jgi:hypothetical protein